MFPLPVRSYSCNTIQSLGQPPKFSREFKTIHDDFKEVEANIDETRQAIERHQPQQVIGKNLDRLDLQLRKVHPEVTEITEETDELSPRDKKFLTFESKVLTDKLNNLTQTLPDQNLRGKAAYLTEAQKTFQALMNFEFKFPGRDPERRNEESFDKHFRHWANEILRSMEKAKRSRVEEEERLRESKKFYKTELTLKAPKPVAGLAY